MTVVTAPTRVDLDNATILLLDDEESVVAGLARSLRGRYVVHTATDPFAALDIVASLPQLAVVISDMRMPGMDGATFLRHVREQVPDAVRLLLTGHSDLEAAVSAINEGRIFRFLWKPCPPDALHACLEDAVTQHRLITAERELLHGTLHGALKALLETLSLANPLAFSRAQRIKRWVTAMAEQMGAGDDWEIDVAAMLSQLGAVTLPPSMSEALHAGDILGTKQPEMVSRIPTISVDLLADVPRLDGVRRIILFQDQRMDGRGRVMPGVKGEDIPLGARLLRVATEYDAMHARRMDGRDALAVLRTDPGEYDPAILDVLERLVTIDEQQRPIRQLRMTELQPGMELSSDIVTAEGLLLCGQGQQITDRILDRLGNWSRHHAIREPINVLARVPAEH